jgi:hypothetical protein
MMLRTLGATGFALSNAWAFTPDRQLYARAERCKNNTVSNNYITRIGDYLAGGAGISCMYAENLKIMNNEITDLPYSGMSIGWGWFDAPAGSSNILIQGNYVHNVTRMLYDGGALYTLGYQPGSVVSENYFDNMVLGNGGLYGDAATAFTVWTDNVVTDTQNVYFIAGQPKYDMEIKNTYSDQSHKTNRYAAQNPNSGFNLKSEDVKTYLPGIPSIEAYGIMKSAGIRNEYAHIKDLVYKEAAIWPDFRYNTRDMRHYGCFYDLGVSAAERADAILGSGNFGDLPGQYPVKYIQALENAKSALTAATGNVIRTIDAIDVLRQTVNTAAAAVVHLDATAMTEVCEEALNAAEPGAYPDFAIEAFQTAINGAGRTVSETLSPKEDYAVTRELEAAYIAFEKERLF